MKRLRLARLRDNQSGFIPMLLFVLAIVVAGIVFIYLRVKNAQ
jgi:hypothetical protein